VTKQEFLSRLSKMLEVLNKQERDDILAEYSQHIDMKVQEGMSEEDAINDFGDIESLAKEILEAYNLDTNFVNNNTNTKKKKKDAEKALSERISGFADRVADIADAISKKSSKELLSLLLKFIIMLVVLCLLRIPVKLLIGLGFSMFAYLPGYASSAISGVIAVLVNLVYIAVFFYSIYYFFKRAASSDTTPNQREKRITPNNTISDDEWDNEDLPETQPMPVQKRKSILDIQKSASSAAHTVGKIIGIIIKTVITLLMVPVILFTLLIVILFGVIIACLISGLSIYGLALIGLGCILCLGAFIWAVFKALFTSKRAQVKTASESVNASIPDKEVQ